ncbi:MAG: hypothetical protein J2O48_01550, partial [Solirubrobacterales bacterium]|nr:hypothetical protein [Solirubrobacterales bacterium]
SVGLDAGPFRDIWSVVQAGPTPSMTRDINQGNKLLFGVLQTILAKTKGESPAAQNNAINNDPVLGRATLPELRDVTVSGIARKYTQHPVPVQFLLIISPLVTWLWAGAAIMICGGLLALWPAPFAARRRELALYRARLARELV